MDQVPRVDKVCGRTYAELDSVGTLISRFVYSVKPNVPSYLRKGTTNYKIVSSHLGSPRLVVNASTGTVEQRITYDVMGKITLDTNPGYQPFAFAGGLGESSSGLIRFGARDYDPETGRWTSKDPILFKGGDTNSYGYVLNDPVNLVDPSGNCPACATGAVGAIVGAGAALANSSSCSFGGKAIDVALGTASGFAGGFLAGVGFGTPGFGSGLLTAVGGTAAGAGPSFFDLYVPNGDSILGNSGCKPPPPGGQCK